ncbi:PIN-like domain-containing protein [Kitasatospora azatica]|uniref:PIN-like domain-containing protein n=1 Tax=Kitasatospora azatica TaxID=58347 RepID=UPI000567A153|nr:PIN domain-containing protein [Kitasatospora azatica]
MKQQFSEYYSPSDEEYKAFLQEGIISLDANVLLSPYRVDREARGQIFELLEVVADRLWVTYQAAWEFFQNRPSVLAGEDKVYQKLQAPLATAKTQLEAHMATIKHHPVVSSADCQDILRSMDAIIEKVNRLSGEKDSKLEDALRTDPILEKWERLLEGRVADRPPLAELEEFKEEADKRLREGVPPGNRDEKKDENGNGDAVLWLQLLRRAKEQNKPVLLITNDTKDDWYRRHGGKTLGPRVELVREMMDGAGVPYYQQPLPSFIRRAGSTLHKPVSEKTVTQARHSSPQEAARHYENAVWHVIADLHGSGQLVMVSKQAHDNGTDLLAAGRSGITVGIDICYITPGRKGSSAYVHQLLGKAAVGPVNSILIISNEAPTQKAISLLGDGIPNRPVAQWITWDPLEPSEILAMQILMRMDRSQVQINRQWPWRQRPV